MSGHDSTTVRFYHISQTDKLIKSIYDEARKLKQRHHQIISCAVTVEKQQRRHLKGNPIRAQIRLELPGKVIVSSKKSDHPDEFTSASAALSHAFNAAEHAVSAHLNRCLMVRRDHYRPRLFMDFATE